MLIGPHIRELRHLRAYTHEQLAERAELTSDTIRRLEHEHGDFNPRYATLQQLCWGLDISFSTLIDGLCRKDRIRHGEAPERVPGLTPDQRRAALFASGLLTRGEPVAGIWRPWDDPDL